VEYRTLRSSPGNKIAKVEGGNVVWVDAPTFKTPTKAQPKSSGFASITDLTDHHHHHHHEHHPFHHDQHHHLHDSDDDEDIVEKFSQIPRIFWTDEILLRLLSSEGEEITKKVMHSAGFHELEIERAIVTANEHLQRHKKSPPPAGGHVLRTVRTDNVSPPHSTTTTTTSVVSSSSSPLTVDPNSPVTTIRIRLIDGSTKQIKVNHSHTISDIKEHIRQLSGVQDFKLMNNSVRPAEPLSELSLTVKEANLLNTMLIQDPH